MIGLYKVVGSDPADLQAEVNRIFEIVSNRLDKIEGFRGEPEVWARQVNKGDIVVDSYREGIVLRDELDPPGYWRITVDSTGTLTQTSLGREYK